MVRVDFLCLPGLLQGTSLLQRAMPVNWETKQSPTRGKRPTAKLKIAAGMA